MQKLSERIAALSPEKLLLLDRQLKGRNGNGTRQERIPRRKEVGPAPLSFAQQRLYFLDRLTPGSAAYNISSATWLSGEVDEGALERA
ncbi:MAG: condensation protein, partial [Blastocatellia bacterium]